MKFTNLDNAFLYLTSICLLSIMVLQLLFRRKLGDLVAGRLLLGYFLSYLYLIGITYLFVYGEGAMFAHTLRTGYIAILLMPPLAFFYMRQCLDPKPWAWKDTLHLLPVLMYMVDLAPFFALSALEKWHIYQQMTAVEYRLGLSQGKWMPTYGYLTIRTVQMLVYWVLQWLLLRKWNKHPDHPLRVNSPYTWKWLHIFLYTQAITFLLPVLGITLRNSHLEVVIFSASAAGAMVVQCFYLLLHPEILYTDTFQREAKMGPQQMNQEKPDDDAKIVEKRLSVEEVAEMKPVLTELMQRAQPFNQHRYTLRQLSDDTGLSAHKLSAFIHQEYGLHFNDYLNRLRIDAVIKKLDSGEWSNKTLEAIAQECGFQSRATFIRAFKKEQGMTPGEYLDRQNQPQSAE